MAAGDGGAVPLQPGVERFPRFPRLPGTSRAAVYSPGLAATMARWLGNRPIPCTAPAEPPGNRMSGRWPQWPRPFAGPSARRPLGTHRLRRPLLRGRRLPHRRLPHRQRPHRRHGSPSAGRSPGPLPGQVRMRRLLPPGRRVARERRANRQRVTVGSCRRAPAPHARDASARKTSRRVPAPSPRRLPAPSPKRPSTPSRPRSRWAPWPGSTISPLRHRVDHARARPATWPPAPVSDPTPFRLAPAHHRAHVPHDELLACRVITRSSLPSWSSPWPSSWRAVPLPGWPCRPRHPSPRRSTRERTTPQHRWERPREPATVRARRPAVRPHPQLPAHLPATPHRRPQVPHPRHRPRAALRPPAHPVHRRPCARCARPREPRAWP